MPREPEDIVSLSCVIDCVREEKSGPSSWLGCTTLDIVYRLAAFFTPGTIYFLQEHLNGQCGTY